MPMNLVIQEKRRELGLTQEQVAQYLGVSTPAVSKWEKGITCPDIALLPSLARLLKTDLNGLFCFRQDLTAREISGFCGELGVTAQTGGIQAAFAQAEELLRQFPHNEELMQCVTMHLDGLLQTSGLARAEKAELEESVTRWYGRLERSDDSGIRNTAHYMMAGRYIRMDELDKAQETLDKMPDRDAIVKDYADKLLLQVLLYMRRGEPELAARELERALLQAVNRAQLLMCKLADAELAAGEQAKAAHVAEKSQDMARLLDLWEYTSYVAPFQLAVAEKDGERTLPLLRQMLHSALRPWDMTCSPLYHRIAAEGNAAPRGQMLAAVLSELERDEGLEYLRGDARFHSLIGEFREKLKERA